MIHIVHVIVAFAVGAAGGVGIGYYLGNAHARALLDKVGQTIGDATKALKVAIPQPTVTAAAPAAKAPAEPAAPAA
jgi:hypothetical protein